MPELNTDIPQIGALLRNEYLYDLQNGHGEFTPCLIHYATSIPTRAVMFTALLENGAQVGRLPISAFVHKRDAPDIPLHYLELWDCFSYDIVAYEHDALKALRCATILKNGEWFDGIYEFTFDWYGARLAEDPGEEGYKTGHVIKLDCGLWGIQPNNRVRFYEPSFITKPFPDRPDYKTNTHIWQVENQGPKWATEDSDRFFYDVHTEPEGS